MDTNLIDTYISEVGRQLTGKNKSDIEAEIRSALQDILDERSRKTGKPVDQKMILAVLQDYGSPEKVAASYQGERYLIGPKLYPVFLRVLQIVLPIVGIVTLIGMGFSLARLGYSGEMDILSTLSRIAAVFFKAIGNFLGTMISVLGGMTLGFSLLERFVPDFKVDEEKEWQARSLLNIPKPTKISRGELIVEIVFTSLAIVIFNFFPQLVGFTPSLNSVIETGNWSTVPFFSILSETFLGYVPYLTVLWGMTIILDGILLQRGRWEGWTRWLYLQLKILSITLVFIMLLGPSLVTGSTDALVASGLFSQEVANTLVRLLELGIRLALVLTIIFESVDVGKGIYRLFKSQSQRQAVV
jgi:hypothetical protein